MVSLSKILTSVDFLELEVCSIGPVEDFPKKAGGTYEAQECKAKTLSGDDVYTIRIFPSVAATWKEKDIIRAKMGENGYPQYEKVDTTATQGQPSTYHSLKNEKAASAIQNEHDITQRYIARAGYGQSFVDAFGRLYVDDKERQIDMERLAKDAAKFGDIAVRETLKVAQESLNQ